MQSAYPVDGSFQMAREIARMNIAAGQDGAAKLSPRLRRKGHTERNGREVEMRRQ